MSIAAAVVVDHPVALFWLGHMPVVNWVLAQLADVRGLQCTVVLTRRHFAATVRRYVEPCAVSVHELPDALLGQEIESFVWSPSSPLANHAVVLLVQALTPFTSAASLELCLRQAKQQAQSVVVARPCQVVVGKRLQPAQEIVLQIRALHRPGVDASLTTVPVGFIESLRVVDPEQLQLAQALVFSGNVL